MSFAEAEPFAKETLNAAHVTGAQLAVLDGGRLVWSTAYGLRRRDPELPMTRETTTWAPSITRSVMKLVGGWRVRSRSTCSQSAFAAPKRI